MTDPYDIDWAAESARLAGSARSDADWYRMVAAALVRPADRTAVDVGCGGGGMALVLARTLGAGATVVGVDGAADVLAKARELAAAEQAPVEFLHADLHHGFDALHDLLPAGADLIWAAGSVHHLGDQQAAVTALAGLLRPGGRLALAEGGLAARHLPYDLGIGEPGLESRLQAAHETWFSGMRMRLPGSVRMPYGWPTALRRAGLQQVTARSWQFDRPDHTPDLAGSVLHRFGHHVPRLRDAGLLSDADVTAWQRLLDPADEAWLGNRDDLYHLESRTVYSGTRDA